MNNSNDFRYTYGYQNGWNVENEYIRNMQSLLEDYNAQVEKIRHIEDDLRTFDEVVDIRENPAPKTDEELRNQYQEDYGVNPDPREFERYKRAISEEENRIRNERQQEFERQSNERLQNFDRKNDERIANVYYLIDIKNRTIRDINREKERLDILREELEIELRTINLNSRKLSGTEGFDPVANQKRYDEVFLKLQKVRHALQELDKFAELMKFTEEEQKIMMSGLNPQQRKYYDDINKSKKQDDDDKDKNDDIDDDDKDKNDDIDDDDKDKDDDIDDDDKDKDDDIDDDDKDKDNDIDDRKKLTNWDQIVAYVNGDYTGSVKKLRIKYTASNIRVFALPKYSKQGNLYKVAAAVPFVGGLLTKAIGKAYGKILDTEKKGLINEMKERANKLTDAEVEIILRDQAKYAGSRKGAKLFSEIVRDRVEKYIFEKVDAINSKIEAHLQNIVFISKVAEKLNDKIEKGETLSDKEIDRLNDLIYEGSESVKKINKLQSKGYDLLAGSGLHSFEETARAHKSMERLGGVFEKEKIDAELQSRLGDLQEIIEKSNNPEDVLNAYLAQTKILSENTKYKKQALNLGSKASVGLYEYNPFVGQFDYRNDDLLSNSLTSIAMITSMVALAKTIAFKAHVKAEEAKINQDIASREQQINQDVGDHNRIVAQSNSERAGYEQFRQDVASGDTVAKDAAEHQLRIEPSQALDAGERDAFMRTDYSFNQTYRNLDGANHSNAANMYQQGQQAIATGDTRQMIGTLRQFDTQTQGAYGDAMQSLTGNATPSGVPYVKAHPEHILDSTVGGYSEMAKNPGAVTDLIEHTHNMADTANGLTPLSPVSPMASVTLDPVSLSSPSIIPAAVAAGSIATKAGQEGMKNPETTESLKNQKTVKELREDRERLIESIKNGTLVSDEEVDEFIEQIEARAK